jgi:hypothetical protein
MVLTSAATTDANTASKEFRNGIRSAAIALGYPVYPLRDQGNNPLKLDVYTSWGEPIKIPLIIDTAAGRVGVQPIIQEGRGNGYQNVFYRLLATASAYPFPLAIIVSGNGFLGDTAPARFYRYFKSEASKMPEFAFVGNASEFGKFLANTATVSAREVA